MGGTQKQWEFWCGTPIFKKVFWQTASEKNATKGICAPPNHGDPLKEILSTPKPEALPQGGGHQKTLITHGEKRGSSKLPWNHAGLAANSCKNPICCFSMGKSGLKGMQEKGWASNPPQGGGQNANHADSGQKPVTRW